MEEQRASLFTEAPHVVRGDEHNLQLNSGIANVELHSSVHLRNLHDQIQEHKSQFATELARVIEGGSRYFYVGNKRGFQ